MKRKRTSHRQSSNERKKSATAKHSDNLLARHARFEAGHLLAGNIALRLTKRCSRVVEEFGAGVLIEDLDAGSILSAIQKIEANYDYYAQNCLKAAAHFSFEESLQPFIDELLVS